MSTSKKALVHIRSGWELSNEIGNIFGWLQELNLSYPKCTLSGRDQVTQLTKEGIVGNHLFLCHFHEEKLILILQFYTTHKTSHYNCTEIFGSFTLKPCNMSSRYTTLASATDYLRLFFLFLMFLSNTIVRLKTNSVKPKTLEADLAKSTFKLRIGKFNK